MNKKTELANKCGKELQMQNSEAFYNSLVENIPQSIICKDLEGNFTFVNQKFCQFIGRSFEEIIGKNDFAFFPPGLAQKYREDDHRVMEKEETLDTVEENKVDNGVTKYVHVIKTPIHDNEGKVIGMQGIFWDITKRVRAEQELKNANERMRQDLISASKVQRGFFPNKAPIIPGYRFSWLFEPSEYVGGDLLDVFQLDDHHWAFYVLDVSGHGVPAALLSVSISRMIDQTPPLHDGSPHDEEIQVSKEFFDPKKVVNILSRRFPGNEFTFCTLVYAILNTKTGSIKWVRAGHEPPILIKKDGIYCEIFKEPGGMMISRLPVSNLNVPMGQTKLEKGDRFILYSDGITETMRDDIEFGYDRLARSLSSHATVPLDMALKLSLKSSKDWGQGKKINDDVTILGLERVE